MRSRAWFLTLLWLVGGAASSAVAAPTDETLDLVGAAVRTYAEALDSADRELRLELFRRSERLFAAAAARGGATADLYSNLGNAALQSENLGSAVLAYRRALLLDPDHPRATQNLEHVRDLAPDWVPRREAGSFLDSFFFWHRTLSRAERELGAAVAFAIAGVLLALGIGLRSSTARNLAILPFVGWCALMVSLTVDPAAGSAEDAVVTAPETIARSADSMHAAARFSRPLPMGTEVRVVERRDEWLRVGLANNREAWVRASSVTAVAP
jgi:tetratricopeptide (TPR) repeat protein